MNEPVSRIQATQDALSDRLAELLSPNIDLPSIGAIIHGRRIASALIAEGWIRE